MASTTLGTVAGDRVGGTPNDDVIIGLSGFDTLFGNEGNDSLYGNQEPDTLEGGAGNDEAHGGKDSDRILGNLDNDTLWGDLGNDTIDGGMGDDILFGNEGEDTLFGEGGNDQIYGNPGNDTMRGADGNDLIRGGTGIDLLYGDGGDDILIGDRDTDTLNGGDGNDLFVLRKGLGSATISEADAIADFVDGKDLITLVEGLIFEDLNIFQGSGVNIRDTIIQDKRNGQILAVLQAVDVNSVNRGDFIIPGTVAFSAPTFTVSENGTPVTTVIVTRTDGSDVPISTTVTLTNGSATPARDYDNQPIVVNFASGDTTPKIVTIPIVDDTLPESTETINLTLSPPTGGAVLGEQTTAVLQITDNDIQSTPKLTIRNPNRQANSADFFGFSLAAVGNNIIVGAPDDDSIASNAGAAYLFDGATGALRQTFQSPNASAFDQFGWAIASVSTRVAIGARLDNSTGLAYLFDSITGSLLRTFVPPAGIATGQFGHAIAAVDNNFLIGAPATDIGTAVDSGAAHLYDGATGNLLLSLFDPTPNPGSRFGNSVVAVGNNLLVGAPFDGNGAAYLFDGTTGALLRTFDNPNPQGGGQFGVGVAAIGNNAIVQSVGNAYLFDTSNGTLLQTYQNTAPNNQAYAFQNSVAAIGNNVLLAPSVDTRGGNNIGSVSLFDSVTGGLLTTFASPNPSVFETFGNSVAGIANGIAVGAPDAVSGGSVYLF